MAGPRGSGTISSMRTAGKLGAACSALLLVTAGVAGAAHGRALSATWSGTWNLMGGVQLTQNGSTVTGKLVSAPTVTFAGTASGSTLTLVSRSDNGLQALCRSYKFTFASNAKYASGFVGDASGPAGTSPSCPTPSIPIAGGIQCVAGACLAHTT